MLDKKAILKSAQGAVNSGYYTDEQRLLVELQAENKYLNDEKRKAKAKARRMQELVRGLVKDTKGGEQTSRFTLTYIRLLAELEVGDWGVAEEEVDGQIESGLFYGHQVIRRVKYDELKAENKNLSIRCKQQESYNKSLVAQNRQLLREYIKTWEVLRTYNPKDIELEYIGFETVEGGDD